MYNVGAMDQNSQLKERLFLDSQRHDIGVLDVA